MQQFVQTGAWAKSTSIDGRRATERRLRQRRALLSSSGGDLRALLLVGASACGGVVAAEPQQAGHDLDSGGADGSIDASDAGVHDTVYHDITDAVYWSVFDITQALPGAEAFAGAAFDGRYVYLAGTPTARYDTRSAFASNSSWASLIPRP